MREVGALGSEVRKQVATFSKKDQVIKLSPNLVKLNVVIIFSQFLVKFLSTILMIFLVRVKSDNIFTKFCENFGESPNFVKNSVLIMSQNLVKLNVVILFSQNFVKF